MRFDSSWVAEALASSSRLQTLHSTGLLDTPPEERFDRLTRLAASFLRAPIALISLLDERRQFIKSQVGLPEPWASARQLPLDLSICRYVVANRRAVVVDDTWGSDLLRDHPGVQAWRIRAYAGVPLTTQDHQVLGVLAVVHTQPQRIGPDQVSRLHELAQMITTELDLRVSNAALARALGRLRAILEQAPLAILLVNDANGVINAVSPKTCSLFGYSNAELMGSKLDRLFLPEDVGDRPLLEPLATRRAAHLEREIRYLRKDGKSFWGRLRVSIVRDPQSADFAVVILEDITESKEVESLLQQQAAKLKALALTDPLTGLSNFLGFLALGEQALRTSQRRKDRPILLFFDLDGLKITNEKLGYEMGNRMIREFAQLLRETFRQADVLARLSSDEMAVLALEVHEGGLAVMLDRLQDHLDELNSSGLFPFTLSTAVGHVVFDPAQPESLETLLNRAEAAMFRDKQRQRKLFGGT